MTGSTGFDEPPRLNSAADLLLENYVHRLRQAARSIPSWQRQLFLDEVAGQIDAELGVGADVGLEQMQALLSRLGDPERLARAGSSTPDWPGGQELAAVLVVLIGGVVVPLVGWLAGLVLLWASPRWRVEDKLLGTLVWPGGLTGLGVLLWVGIAHLLSAPPAPGPGILPFALLAGVLGVPPVLVAIALLHSARRPHPGRWLAGMPASVPGEPVAAG